MAITQDGDQVSVFTLERNFETGLAEVGYGSWTPSAGFSARRVFGTYSAKFGGSVGPVPRGARIYGLSDFRAPDERVVTRRGIQLFRGQEIGLTCSGLHGAEAVVYPDGNAMLVKTNQENCGRLQCPHLVFMSTDIDGGRSCPLEGLSETDVNPETPRGGGLISLHPSMRVAAMDNIDFFQWGSDGQRLGHALDGGIFGRAQFWPTTERVPTRVDNKIADIFRSTDGGIYYYSWEDAGIVRYDTPFSKYMHVLISSLKCPLV